MADSHPAYRREGDAYLVELNLSDPRQLFNSLDPAPFIAKDLDDDAVSYILESVKEFPIDTPLKLLIHLPRTSQSAVSESIPESIRNYFGYRMRSAARQLVFVFRKGRLALLGGLTLLFLCLLLSDTIGHAGEGPLYRILSEGLLIGGWVAMWRPTEFLLYDWWPLRWERKIFEKVAQMPVELRFYD